MYVYTDDVSFVGKPVVALQNVCYFVKLMDNHIEVFVPVNLPSLLIEERLLISGNVAILCTTDVK